MTLDNLPTRPDKTTRLKITLDMKSEELAHVAVYDLGFGTIFPSSGLKWEEEFTLL